MSSLSASSPVRQIDPVTIAPGSRVGNSEYTLNERTSFIGKRSGFTELPWEEIPSLPGPDGPVDSHSTDIMLGPATHLKAWSAYYSSSFFISSCAGRGAHGEVWRGVMGDNDSTRVVLKRIYSAKGSPTISAAMREVYYGQMFGQTQTFASRYISHFIEDGDLWLVFRDEGISLYQSIFHPVFVGQLSVMTRSVFWRHLRKYPRTVLGHIFSQILTGLDQLHTHFQIVHRDIKLENIFIDITNSHIRIGDFGSASPYPKNESSFALFPPSGPSIDEETTRYAPPESDRVGDVTARTPSFDMWCVGIMWIELWLGTVNIVEELCIGKVNCAREVFAKQIKKLDPLGIGFDLDMLDLVWEMVRFDPNDRISASTALLHSFFNKDRLAIVKKEPKTITFRSSVASSIGHRSQMEDRFIVLNTSTSHRDFVFACVMDGHNGDEVAEHLQSMFGSEIGEIEKFDIQDIQRIIQQIVIQADSLDYANDLMGSTVACIAISSSGEYIVGNVGDSRIILVEETDAWEPCVGANVLFNENDSGRIVEYVEPNVFLVIPDEQPNRKKAVRRENLRPIGQPIKVVALTRDHKPDDPIERKYIESKGGTVSMGSPARVEGILAVSRSVGARSLKPFVRSEMEFSTGTLSGEKVKKLILATDGIWDVLTNYEVGESLTAEAVIDAATRKGARDNMAVVMFDLLVTDQCPSVL